MMTFFSEHTLLILAFLASCSSSKNPELAGSSYAADNFTQMTAMADAAALLEDKPMQDKFRRDTGEEKLEKVEVQQAGFFSRLWDSIKENFARVGKRFAEGSRAIGHTLYLKMFPNSSSENPELAGSSYVSENFSQMTAMADAAALLEDKPMQDKFRRDIGVEELKKLKQEMPGIFATLWRKFIKESYASVSARFTELSQAIGRTLYLKIFPDLK